MKKILMFMPVMKGGGAERVASLLMNEFHKNGFDTEFILTSSDKKEVLRRDLSEDIPIICLKKRKNIFLTLIELFASAFCKIFEKREKAPPALLSYLSFASQYGGEIKQIRQKLKANPDATAIAFLQPAIPMLMLAARGLKNKVIFSERGDPIRLMKHRYGEKFITKYYERASAAVFQTEDAKNAYPENISKKGTVIFNPIREGLPRAYHGERNGYITTFCRISRQKNLPLLIKAFAKINKIYPQYRLRIIGSAQNADDEACLAQCKKLISELSVGAFVDFEPFSQNVHELILHDAMYVNSSDYEGMSNAMLEAMAIGMPCVCTDCPIGGANAVIRDGENGLLVPVKDENALYEAMKKILTDRAFSEKLSLSAEKIRYELSLENTAKKWMEII